MRLSVIKIHQDMFTFWGCADASSSADASSYQDQAVEWEDEILTEQTGALALHLHDLSKQSHYVELP